MELQHLKDKLQELDKLKADAKFHERESDRLKKESKRLQAELHAIMTDFGIPSIKVEGVQFVAKQTIFGHVQDKEAFEAWCLENEVDDIYLKTAEEKQRVSELVREAIDSGRELPPGVTFYVRDYISATESK